MLHNEVASSEKAGPDWVKHACRRMKHFAALPQNMKHRRCGMKQSLFRLHVFCLEIKAKKMAEREGFEPSVILLVKSRLKRCFIPPFERKFLKF